LSEPATAYAQLLSVGLVWISLHCSGMCGPLLIGFDVAGAASGVGALRGALSVLIYQAGRAVTYLALGVLAGLLGKGLASTFEAAGAVFALGFGLAVLGSLLHRLWDRQRPVRPGPTRLERRADGSKIETHDAKSEQLENQGNRSLVVRIIAAIPRALHPLAGGDEGRGLRVFGLGLAMGLLPCMITYWTLGLAAMTGSPWHGALLMLLLVAMTTPVLLGVTLIPRVIPRRFSRVLPKVLMGLSGAWLFMVGLAGLGVVDHLHLGLGDYTIMLW
jgi:hypothetical protein